MICREKDKEWTRLGLDWSWGPHFILARVCACSTASCYCHSIAKPEDSAIQLIATAYSYKALTSENSHYFKLFIANKQLTISIISILPEIIDPLNSCLYNLSRDWNFQQTF